MLWKLVQAAVFFGVIASNIEYKWAEGTSGYAVALIAAFAAFLVTAIPFAIMDLASKLKALWLLLRRKKRVDDSRLTRV
jgi:hypothetical protein